MKIRYALIALLLGSILSVVALTPALAKELVKVIVLGPGLNGEVEITDPDQVSFFENLIRLPVIEEKPEGLSDAFFEIRMAVGSEDNIVAYNVYNYYPAQVEVGEISTMLASLKARHRLKASGFRWLKMAIARCASFLLALVPPVLWQRETRHSHHAFPLQWQLDCYSF